MPAVKGTRPPNAGKGRKAGTPNKVSGQLKDMILKALDKAGGVNYLVKQAEESPNAFLALVGKVLPMQVAGPSGAVSAPRRVIIELDDAQSGSSA